MFVGINVFPCTNFVFSATLFRNCLYTLVFYKFAFQKLLNVVLLLSSRQYYSSIFMSSFLLIDKCYITNIICMVGKKSNVSRLNIHDYHNRRYKSYITSLKAVITGKNSISAGLDIDRIMHFSFFYRYIWLRISKNWCVCVCVPGVTPLHSFHWCIKPPLPSKTSPFLAKPP